MVSNAYLGKTLQLEIGISPVLHSFEYQVRYGSVANIATGDVFSADGDMRHDLGSAVLDHYSAVIQRLYDRSHYSVAAGVLAHIQDGSSAGWRPLNEDLWTSHHLQIGAIVTFLRAPQKNARERVACR